MSEVPIASDVLPHKYIRQRVRQQVEQEEVMQIVETASEDDANSRVRTVRIVVGRCSWLKIMYAQPTLCVNDNAPS